MHITFNDKMKVLPSSILSVATVLFSTVVTTTAAPSEDEVVSYLGFGPPPTQHYSGYLDVSDACDTVRVTVYSIHRRVFPYSFDSFDGILSRYYLLSAGLRTLSLQLHLYQLDILRFSCCASPGRTEALIDIKKRIVCLRRNYARKAQSPRATPPRF